MDGNVEFTTLLHRVPLEVRCMIYRNLLSTEETKQPCVDRGVSFVDGISFLVWQSCFVDGP